MFTMKKYQKSVDSQYLTLKVPIMTAADNINKYFFIVRVDAEDSHKKSSFTFFER